MEKDLYKNKEWLSKKLQNHSVQEICAEINCSEMTIYRWKKKLGIKNEIPNYENPKWLRNELLYKTADIIAKENNVSSSTILRYASKFNINPKQKRYKDKNWLQKTLADCNGMLSEISKKYGYKEDTLREWCHKFGLDSSTRKRMYRVDEKYFETIDTEHKAYWIGFLMADGFVRKDCNTWGMILHTKDKQILEQLKIDIQYSGSILDSCYNNKPTSRILICSHKMTTNLICHGIIPRKTGKETLPSSIPKEYIKDFIRGFLDGDGCIYKRDKGIDFCSASLNILYSIKKYVENELNGKEYKIKTVRKESDIELFHYDVFGKTAIILANHIYKDATIYLQRKYDIYKTKLCVPLIGND